MGRPLIVTLDATSSSRTASVGSAGLQSSRPSPETSITVRVATAGICGTTLSAMLRNIFDRQVNSPLARGSLRIRAATPFASAADAMRTHGNVISDRSAHVMIENKMAACGPVVMALITPGSSSALAMPSICSR